MAASQPNKATRKWVDDSDDEGDKAGWLEVGLRKVKEQDAAELARKKREAEELERETRRRMNNEYWMYQMRERRKIEDAKKQRQKDSEEKWKKSLILERAKQEREDKIFRDRVLYEANLAREKAEEEEETTSKRKDKGKGPSCTQ